MTTTLRVRFDGKVITPMEPADLPIGREFEIQVSDPLKMPLQELGELLDQLPFDPDMPPDAAAQHDHYLYGTPKHP